MDIGAIGLYVCLFIALYFEVVLLISFFERKPEVKTAALPSRYPTVAMVVPCFNEEKTLGKTIDSLLALSYPKDKLEIIVVDDGSRDNTRAIGEAYAKAHPQVSFYSKENGGKYTALNYAIERTQAEIVGCLDADSFVVEDALIEAVKEFERDPATMAITPAMKVHHPHKILEMMQAVEYTFGIFYKKMFDNLAAINVLPGPFSMYKREIFKKIGPFRHAHNTEDMEIAFRMHSFGLKIANAHTAVVYTTVPQTVRALLKQRTRWSRGFLENARDYSYMFFNPKYGNFGMLVLPFGVVAFAAGIYTACYAFLGASTMVIEKLGNFMASGIPLHVPSAANLSWYYLNTNMSLFVIIAVLSMTMIAIILGNRIARHKLTPLSFAAYFALFGFIAPLWLMRAAFEVALARKHTWR
jgi:cellulose synthase/poly-beta-1,6-N-acetylglucosamine synthase-like glycosyltransferase